VTTAPNPRSGHGIRRKALVSVDRIALERVVRREAALIYTVRNEGRTVNVAVNNRLNIVARDSWLAPYEGVLVARQEAARRRSAQLTGTEKSLADFASAHEYFGLHRTTDGWIFRERAPHASRIFLIGDFSGWTEQQAFALTRRGGGVWEAVLPADALRHGQHYKLKVYWPEPHGEVSGERIPAFARRVVQDETTKLFSAQVWEPEQPYRWRHPEFRVPARAPRIYEAHVGMAQEEGRVGSYAEFREHVLPRVARAGYNTIQLMAIQEHPYYGSFGYQVSNFFAPSSRFGTPDELRELVDAAHGLGLAVIMDLVHSHAVKNELEGLSRFDGSTTLYFHGGPKGEHPAWNTRCFDYGKIETLHLLLSNCRYWLDAFHFDGYRFDGVTSMLYWDHGLGSVFTSYDQYFDGNVDPDALLYLTLANEVVHAVRPDAITVAEDVSGMPGLAASFEDGGIGFDYRLAMGVPDLWIKLIKEQPDEAWNVGWLWWELTNRREEERTIGYCESHDQALVGDKTIMFRLADQEMYWSMRKTDQSLVIDRAVALHKVIRLVTLATAGNGYLTFMGNEFGHPEWIDFPREGNGWSYHHARRQWRLADDPLLRYHELGDFDRAMMELCERSRLLEAGRPHGLWEHVADQVLAFERAGLVFVFNFNPVQSFTGYGIPVREGRGEYRLVLDSDAAAFGGFQRVNPDVRYPVLDHRVTLYIPNRSALVLEPAA
jgi:1,4-alpha-glucan branching enzyme